MARIVFWSPSESMTGTTHSAIAVSTLMSIVHKTTSVLMHGNYDSKKIESSFTPFDELKNSGTFLNSNVGVSALIRLVTSNKLTSETVKNYAKPVLKERLDILYGMTQKDEEAYLDVVNNLTYITRKADEIYDLVFIDAPKGTTKKYVLDTLADAEVVVCLVNQDEVKLEEFFNTINEMEEIKNKDKIIVIGDYESRGKYNVRNLKTKYRIKDNIYTIPHNYVFADSCNDGNVINFFYNNINADKNDYNGFFVSQTLEIVERIIEITKIKDV